MWMIR